MINENKKEIGKKTISLFEIFVLVVSIVAIGYFLGDEFRIVSAAGNGYDTFTKCKSGSNYCVAKNSLGKPLCSTSNLVTTDSCADSSLTCCKKRPCDASSPDGATIPVCKKNPGDCNSEYTNICEDGTWSGCKCFNPKSTGTTSCSDSTGATAAVNTYSTIGCSNQCGADCQTCGKTCLSTGQFEKCNCKVKAKTSDKKDTSTQTTIPIPTQTDTNTAKNALCSSSCVEIGTSADSFTYSGGSCKQTCNTGTERELAGLCGYQTTGNVCCCTLAATLTTTGETTTTGTTTPTQPEKTEEQKANDELFGKIGTAASAIIFNAGIAIGLFWGTQALKGLNIMPPEVVDQLSWALSLGYGAGSAIYVLGQALGWTGVAAGTTAIPFIGLAVPTMGLIGLGVGAIIWLVAATDKKTIAIYYTCNQWQPPKGGSDCDKCNSDSFLCTSYKCQSLGKSCRLLNQGTAEEKCTWVNQNDIEPPAIVSWNKPLKDNFYYEPASARLTPTQTTSSGVSIKYNGANADANNCIPPYTILKFGIGLTDGTGKPKLGHCKYDIVRTDKFENMKYNVDNLWDMYNHTITMIHGDVNKSIDGINVPNGGNFEVYVRCESTNGYANVGTFVFKYCVSSAPDNEAPQVILTTPLNGMPVSFGATSQDVLVYVNKPSECKWSHANEDYDTMTETMNCEQTMGSNLLYRCNATLNGIVDDKDNNFYFNCKSHPEYQGTENEVYRRSMAQSYAYKLTGTRQLVIDYVKPETGSTIKAATSKVNVKLEAHTSSGYKDGTAWCFFKSSTDTYNLNCNLNGPGLFSNTNSLQHSQDLWLAEGTYTYQIKCCDLGGNSDTEETTFTVDTDREAPIVVRLYDDNKKLKIITNEQAKCFYSINDCSYNIDDGIKFTSTNGIEHTIEWNTNNNLYIKCKDNFDSQPAPNECTIIARPFSNI
jgi:hypothetical protein